jgi:hypothetical protein
MDVVSMYVYICSLLFERTWTENKWAKKKNITELREYTCMLNWDT